MAKLMPRYDNDKVKEEVNNLINEHGLFAYNVERVVSADSVTEIVITLRLFQNDNRNKYIV